MNRLLLWLWRAPFPNWLRWMFLWAKYPKFVATVVAVIIDEQGSTLLFHHTYRDEYPWGLPGGWMESKEDPADAVRREIQEESGLRVRVLRPLWVGSDSHRARLDIAFLAELEGGDFRASDEVDQVTFFAPGELPSLTSRARSLIQMAHQLRAEVRQP